MYEERYTYITSDEFRKTDEFRKKSQCRKMDKAFSSIRCDDWAWLSLNRRSRQLLVTCGYERSVFFLVYDRGNRVDVCKAS
jgi:hypothetical protein